MDGYWKIALAVSVTCMTTPLAAQSEAVHHHVERSRGGDSLETEASTKQVAALRTTLPSATSRSAGYEGAGAARPLLAGRASLASITAVADEFDRAQLAKDAAALRRIVSDSLIFIDGSGTRTGKEEFIAGWTDPSDHFEPIKLIDRTFTPLGPDAWIVSAEVTLKGVSGGKSFSSRIRYSDTFHKIAGRWRVVHIQVTRMK